MKKIILLFATTAFLFFSCTKEKKCIYDFILNHHARFDDKGKIIDTEIHFIKDKTYKEIITIYSKEQIKLNIDEKRIIEYYSSNEKLIREIITCTKEKTKEINYIELE